MNSYRKFGEMEGEGDREKEMREEESRGEGRKVLVLNIPSQETKDIKIKQPKIQFIFTNSI